MNIPFVREYSSFMNNTEQYQTLYQNQDFETLVDVTSSLRDLNMIRYHVIGLLGIGANAQVLVVLRNKLPILKPALHVFLKIHREILKQDPELEDHETLLEAYESLPYLNQEVEELIDELKRLHRRGSFKKPVDFLVTLNQAFDEENEALLLDLIPQIQPIHLYQVREKVKAHLQKDGSQQIKGLLMLMLIDYKFDEVIALKKGQQLLQFNPIDAINPFLNGVLKEAQEQLSRRIKDPSLLQVAQSLLSSYVLRMVPYEVDIEYYFQTALVALARDYLKLPPEHDDYSETEKETIAKKRHHLETILKL
jgi:hypothetical protein